MSSAALEGLLNLQVAKKAGSTTKFKFSKEPKKKKKKKKKKNCFLFWFKLMILRIQSITANSVDQDEVTPHQDVTICAVCRFNYSIYSVVRQRFFSVPKTIPKS